MPKIAEKQGPIIFFIGHYFLLSAYIQLVEKFPPDE